MASYKRPHDTGEKPFRVVALDFKWPAHVDEYCLDSRGEDEPPQGMQTVVQVYEHRNPTRAKADDFNDINLEIDYRLRKEMTMPEYFSVYSPTQPACMFDALVIKDPRVVNVRREGSFDTPVPMTLVEALPASIQTLDISRIRVMPQQLLSDYIKQRSRGSVAVFTAVKGASEAFFEQMVETGLKIRVGLLTVMEKPRDRVLADHDCRCIKAMRVNVQFKPKGIVHYMQLDGDERMEIDNGSRVRRSGALEPFLMVLPSTLQVIRYRVLDLDYAIDDDNGFDLNNFLGREFNAYTETLIIVAASVNCKKRSVYDAFVCLFEDLYNRYRKLLQLFLVFTDTVRTTVYSQTSYSNFRDYMQRYEELLGRVETRQHGRPGLLSAANDWWSKKESEHRGGKQPKRPFKITMKMHQIFQFFRSNAGHSITNNYPGAPWFLEQSASRAADGIVHLLRHQDANENGNPRFNCSIQLAECSRPERVPAKCPGGYRAARQVEDEDSEYPSEYPLKEYEVIMQISPPAEDLTDESISNYRVESSTSDLRPYLPTQRGNEWGWYDWNPWVELAYPAVQKPTE